ncbi:MAG TPA: carbohydrate-binding family 9-like protein [Pyrinomonadaceae bacterium]|nr:carbohydrate-binding family 9-like protein [Pyrinomonadaceae bacterium]
MNKAQVSYTLKSFALDDFENDVWQSCREIGIRNYWSGIEAEEGRQAAARLLWTDEALFVKFTGNRREPLIVDPNPETARKTIGLWERDVFEIFIAPDSEFVSRYFEFEVAPTGEWLDLEIQILPNGERKSNFEYNSKMQAAAEVSENTISAAIKIDWRAFGQTPKAGDVWRGNLFRCIGKGETRGYLAWQPTETAIPNFHVPEKFGYFEFL